MRIGIKSTTRFWDPDARHQVGRARGRCVAPDTKMHIEHLGQVVSDRHHGVQCGQWVLRDQCQSPAPKARNLSLWHRQQVSTLKDDATAVDSAW